MADDININPISQKQLSDRQKKAYKVGAFEGSIKQVDDKKARSAQKSVTDDERAFEVGLRDIDEAIFYYFDNVIRPSVIRNGKQTNVPVLYGSPERWKAVQKDGFYRDRNGKIQLPLILIKRNSIEKNRNLGNKMDANNPHNFGVFKKKWSKKNQYDRFSILNNRVPEKEFVAVVYPDYVTITYSCAISTYYVEQMNKIVEAINYASDSYWGDPERFKFNARIDSFAFVVEANQGEDRSVRTTFNIKLNGYIIPDVVQKSLNNFNKFNEKSKIVFSMEVVTDDAFFNGDVEDGRIVTPEVSEREATKRTNIIS